MPAITVKNPPKPPPGPPAPPKPKSLSTPSPTPSKPADPSPDPRNPVDPKKPDSKAKSTSSTKSTGKAGTSQGKGATSKDVAKAKAEAEAAKAKKTAAIAKLGSAIIDAVKTTPASSTGTDTSSAPADAPVPPADQPEEDAGRPADNAMFARPDVPGTSAVGLGIVNKTTFHFEVADTHLEPGTNFPSGLPLAIPPGSVAVAKVSSTGQSGIAAGLLLSILLDEDYTRQVSFGFVSSAGEQSVGLSLEENAESGLANAGDASADGYLDEQCEVQSDDGPRSLNIRLKAQIGGNDVSLEIEEMDA